MDTGLPIDDPFWLEYYPPLNFGCRCDVQQVGANNNDLKAKELPDEKEVPPMFRNNAGISGQIFTEDHPYYDGLSDKEKQKIEKQANKLSTPEIA